MKEEKPKCTVTFVWNGNDKRAEIKKTGTDRDPAQNVKTASKSKVKWKFEEESHGKQHPNCGFANIWMKISFLIFHIPWKRRTEPVESNGGKRMKKKKREGNPYIALILWQLNNTQQDNRKFSFFLCPSPVTFTLCALDSVYKYMCLIFRFRFRFLFFSFLFVFISLSTWNTQTVAFKSIFFLHFGWAIVMQNDV